MTETGQDHNTNSFYRRLFDAVPMPLIVVDSAGNVRDFNSAAALNFRIAQNESPVLRPGEILSCPRRHDSPHGCGSGKSCGNCVLRRIIRQVLEGQAPVRESIWLETESDGMLRTAITGTRVVGEESQKGDGQDGEALVILAFEMVPSTSESRDIIPICAGCKRIRDEHQSWEDLEHYFSRLIGSDFSHGICPECRMKYYPSSLKD